MLLRRIVESGDPDGLDVIGGARGVGKTSLAKLAYPGRVCHSMDSFESRLAFEQISLADWGRTVGEVVLDDIQRAPTVLENLGYALAESRIRRATVVSAAQVLRGLSGRSGATGPRRYFELWPLMLSELLTAGAQPLKEPILHRLVLGRSPDMALEGLSPEVADHLDLRAAEEHLLAVGGMPELVGLTEAEAWQALARLASLYLERDMGDLVRLSDLKPFHRFQQAAAQNIGRRVSYAELARRAGISLETARRYLEFLRLSYQVIVLPAYSHGLTSRRVTAPKLFWADLGLQRTLSGFRGLLTREMFANHVVAEIWKYVNTLGLEAKLSHYRTRSGMDVDLLVDTPLGLLGCVIRATSRVTPADAAPLRRVAKAAGSLWLGGLIIHRGTRCEPLAENLWSTPSWRLFS